MRPVPTKLLALLMAGAMIAAACGGEDASQALEPASAPSTIAAPSTAAPAGTEPVADATADDEAMDDEAMDDEAMDDEVMDDEVMQDVVPTTDDGASSLRAGLTSLLQEHLYLASIAIETAVDAGGDLTGPDVVAAVATLDENSVALAGAVGSVAGEENGEAFLGLWREHIGFFVEYTLGRATGDDARAGDAVTALDGYKLAAGAFFEEITGGTLVADQVEQVLAPHAVTTFAALDALAAGDAEAFGLVREAAQIMPNIAAALSGGIVAALPDQFPGDANSVPAETRAVLTHLLQEHVYLAGIALEQAVEAGGDLQSPAVAAAVATLDVNSVALAEVIASVAGEENGEAFLGLWREHIGFFVEYTLGRATGDDTRADNAALALDGYKLAAGAFFEEITGGELSADDFVVSLDGHTATVLGYIDAVVAGDPAAYSKLRAAAQHMSGSANAIASAVIAATS